MMQSAAMNSLLLAICSVSFLAASGVNAASQRKILQVIRDCHCEPTENSCCFYEHSNYNGCAYGPYTWSSTTNVGSKANDKFSSMRCGTNVYAIVQEHGTSNGQYRQGTGRTISLIGNEPDFGRFGFHDKTTAVFIKGINGVAVISKGDDPIGRQNNFAIAEIGSWDNTRINNELGFPNDYIDEVQIPQGRSITLFLDDISPPFNRLVGNVGDFADRYEVIQQRFDKPGRYNLAEFFYTLPIQTIGRGTIGNPVTISRVRTGSWQNVASAWEVA